MNLVFIWPVLTLDRVMAVLKNRGYSLVQLTLLKFGREIFVIDACYLLRRLFQRTSNYQWLLCSRLSAHSIR